LGALTALLDTSAFLIASVDNTCSKQARLTFAMCRHTVVDLAQVFYATPRSMSFDRLPPSELARMRSSLIESGYSLLKGPEVDEKLAKLRGMYEPYINALASYLYVDLPPWMLAKEVTDNWKTSAWGRISGFAASAKEEVTVDDHL
jgi:hypothetical protein